MSVAGAPAIGGGGTRSAVMASATVARSPDTGSHRTSVLTAGAYTRFDDSPAGARRLPEGRLEVGFLVGCRLVAAGSPGLTEGRSGGGTNPVPRAPDPALNSNRPKMEIGFSGRRSPPGIKLQLVILQYFSK